MSDSIHSMEDSPSRMKEGTSILSPSALGRPLSMIESIGSSPDEDDLVSASETSQALPAHSELAVC
jgi:hypothetical protein